MTNQDNSLSDLQRHSAMQDARISNLETKFEMFMQSIKESNERRDAELQDFKNEVRQQNEMRQAEIMELRNDIKEIYKTTDSKIDSIRQSVQSIQDSGRNQSIVTFLGIAAMVVAVLLK